MRHMAGWALRSGRIIGHDEKRRARLRRFLEKRVRVGISCGPYCLRLGCRRSRGVAGSAGLSCPVCRLGVFEAALKARVLTDTQSLSCDPSYIARKQSDVRSQRTPQAAFERAWGTLACVRPDPNRQLQPSHERGLLALVVSGPLKTCIGCECGAAGQNPDSGYAQCPIRRPCEEEVGAESRK